MPAPVAGVVCRQPASSMPSQQSCLNPISGTADPRAPTGKRERLQRCCFSPHPFRPPPHPTPRVNLGQGNLKARAGVPPAPALFAACTMSQGATDFMFPQTGPFNTPVSPHKHCSDGDHNPLLLVSQPGSWSREVPKQVTLSCPQFAQVLIISFGFITHS